MEQVDKIMDGNTLEHSIARYGVKAPSSHNTQPWKFKISEKKIKIFPDEEKWLVNTDKNQRELYLSLGCAVENIRVASNYFNFSTEISVPSKGGRPVEIELKPEESLEVGNTFFRAMKHRSTNRNNFNDKKVDKDVLKKLGEVFHGKDQNLHFIVENKRKEEIAELQKKADRHLFASKEYREELAEVVGRGDLGHGFLTSKIAGFIIRSFDLGSRTAGNDFEKMVSSSNICVVTGKETVERWIRTGILFERVFIKSGFYGLSVHPMSQILEFEPTRDKLKEVIGSEGRPIHLFRIGYSDKKPRKTPRRKLKDFLIS